MGTCTSFVNAYTVIAFVAGAFVFGAIGRLIGRR